MEPDIKTWLQDIVDAIDEIDSFIPVKNFLEFKNDLKTKRAVERNIEIIGEAVKRIMKVNIPQVIDGLKETGYLLRLDRKKYLWEDRNDLMDRWISEYATRLKPKLLRGRFKVKRDWKTIQLNTRYTVWGGEPAGNLLTKHLRPEELILYTQETNQEIMKRYKLMPENNGELIVYDWFWNEWYQDKTQPSTAPPFLVYADLKIKNERRCHETAQLIFDEYIQPNL